MFVSPMAMRPLRGGQCVVVSGSLMSGYQNCRPTTGAPPVMAPFCWPPAIPWLRAFRENGQLGLTVTGTGSFTGDVNVNGGTLVVNGDLSAASLMVRRTPGGTLSKHRHRAVHAA